uniref:Uncharacterized protein MANES_01G191800 n=1 Tax=Rhizophora mucronata TaxID=61149 RepID=A0A2P2KKM6_RHIMU
MLSFTNLSPHCPYFYPFQSSSRTDTRKWGKPLVSLQLAAASWGCAGFFVRSCKKGRESGGELALEAEILEFMENSDAPEAFPSKKQLIDAGRLDLVVRILKQGGWLAFGWGSNDDDNDENHENEVVCHDSVEGNDELISQDSLSRVDSCSSASSSGRSMETRTGNDSGIEGILNRLDKERNMNFGFGLRKRANGTLVQSNELKCDWLADTPKNATAAGLKMNRRSGSLNPNNIVVNNVQDMLGHASALSSINGLKNSLKPDMWRTWSNQRAGNSDMKFEADEIASYATRIGYNMDDSGDEILEVQETSGPSLSRSKEKSSPEGTNCNDIRSRLQHLEAELSSVLKTLKSNRGDGATLSLQENSIDNLLNLSDAWEFQENEIMIAQDKLRSIRAKLAVLEGKMTLAIIDAQKIMEEKQQKIDDARKALRLLRTACIVWPNSASEVLLTGSFDGWATKRKMEKSNMGVFMLHLKLYPGRYEVSLSANVIVK